MTSPSRYRREGREAFFRGGDPTERNPYANKGGLTADMHSRDWLDGWQQATEADEMAKAREEREALDEDEKIEEFARLYNLLKQKGLIE
jgi:hypothetical protein